MHVLSVLALLCAMSFGIAAPAHAQPADARDLIGKTHEADLKFPDWESIGGGLLAEPIWYQVHRSKDGAFRVLIDRSLGYRTGSQYMSFQVVDVATTPPLPGEMEFMTTCRAQRTVQGTIVAVVQVNYKQEREWWTNIRRAWTVSPQGKLTAIPTQGIRCLNEAWGR